MQSDALDFRPSRNKARPILFLIGIALVWLVSVLACNFPQRAGNGYNLSASDLRQTLDAQYVAATQGILETAAPVVPLFTGLQTATPEPPAGAVASPTGSVAPPPGLEVNPNGYVYPAQSGDTLPVVAKHFGVQPGQIHSPENLPDRGLIPPGQLLEIPAVIPAGVYPSAILPDSEIINSPSAVGFEINDFVRQAGGYLDAYREPVNGEWLTGAQIVERVASEASVNPRLLLALIEARSGWVYGQPSDPQELKYPLGFHVSGKTGLYQELAIAGTQFNAGYYGWRLGLLTDLQFPTGEQQRISPGLNAGSVAVQYLYSKILPSAEFSGAIYGANGFLEVHRNMFGDPWQRAARVEPLFQADVRQPTLELPFRTGERWSMTGGPHFSWNTYSPRGALDFAPTIGEPECAVSRAWASAVAPGVVARSSNNVLALDLDGDSFEQTGWVVIYMHLADRDRLPVGSQVEQDGLLGHPSCEGGHSTGTHFHIARKFNGEWLAADSPSPFVLSGWQVIAGAKNYQGQLVKGDQVVDANPGGPRTSTLTR